ncbi:hypothetical protein KSD_34850 [Ktedonobacter sp. SOSP1-85]|uniref:hypothetical protein n=1 Tax=Ktedonobacter sp. SOSP1-85 TaxID=2778367 RepID=UPI001914F3A7|nr:hypothetical protein [Ktedonobacter sp. SOSP1-85]GHO75714.1 hypothetical protein KSD_34850 [Ktedonobacter sp. SOSP1-85]
MNTLFVQTSLHSVMGMALAGVSDGQMKVISIALWISAFLCILNIILAVVYRSRSKREVFSYWAICVLELAIFVFALLLRVGVISQVPFHLPPGLPVDRLEIGAALAFGIGLFPAAFWHRVNLSDLPKRIGEDGKAMKSGKGTVSKAPGEWMN